MYVTYIPLTPQLVLLHYANYAIGSVLSPSKKFHSMQQSMLAYLEQWSSAEPQGDKLHTAHTESARNPS